MMPSRAFRSVSLAMASRSTAPESQDTQRSVILSRPEHVSTQKTTLWSVFKQSCSYIQGCVQRLNKEVSGFSYLHKCSSRRHSELPLHLVLAAYNQISDRSIHEGERRHARSPLNTHIEREISQIRLVISYAFSQA